MVGPLKITNKIFLVHHGISSYNRIMPIIYPPRRGEILICDFTNLLSHEMSKVRPVVALSPRIKHRSDICTVVPLSTTKPEWVNDYHYLLHFKELLPPPFDKPEMWLKGDMLYTLNISRMNYPYKKTGQGRRYIHYSVSADDMVEIEKCVCNGLGIRFDIR